MNITLNISGTVTRHGGFKLIVGVDNFPEEEKEVLDTPPLTSSKENPVITLKNADGYVLYKLWDGSVYPSDAPNNPGRLAIGVTMPSNARLRDGKSPYQLLMDIYNKFLEIGTRTDENGRRAFKKENLEKAEFIRIIENYPLESASVKQEVMRGEGTGEICIPKEKMDDFFRDAQYPEFVNFKAIEVTTQGTNMFPNLQIPRPKRYEVFHDGTSTGKFLVQRDDRYEARKEAADGKLYDSFALSLGDLLDSQNHSRTNQEQTVSVKLDEDRCRIDCSFIGKDVTYQIKLSYTKETDDEARRSVDRWIKEGYVKIRKNGRPFIDKNGNPCDKIKHEDAKQAIKNAKTEYPTIDIFPNEIEGYSLSVEDLKITGGLFQIVVKAAKADAAKVKKVEINNGRGLRGTGNLLTMRELVVLLIGLALGIGGMCGLNYWKHSKAEKERIENAKSAEYNAYTVALKLPTHKNYQDKKIESQDENYLKLLQTANGIHPYYEYLKNYGTDNKDAYNANHYNDIISRRDTYKADSCDYVADLAQQAANKERQDKANAAFNKIKEENSKKKPDYANIIKLCEDYQDTYKGVPTENDTQVANILSNAQKKQETAANDEKTRKQVEQKALEFLHNVDLDGYAKWLDQQTEGKTNRKWLKDKVNWIDHLLRMPNGPIGTAINNYLKDKRSKLNDWEAIKNEATKIDDYKKGNISTLE